MTEKASDATRLTDSELSDLAGRFSTLIPEREFTMATIQGHLMLYKTEPYRAVEETGAFIEAERTRKEEERIAKERESEEEKKSESGDNSLQKEGMLEALKAGEGFPMFSSMGFSPRKI